MRDRKLSKHLSRITEQLDQMLDGLGLAEQEVKIADGPPLAVTRECVYSVPYVYYFGFGQEPRAEDCGNVLVWANGALLDSHHYSVNHDDTRVRSLTISGGLPKRVGEAMTEIVILAPLRKEL
jgi:hypothetical protein